MRNRAIAIICAVLGAMSAPAAAAGLTAARLIDICAAPSVEIATQMGDALGWPRLPDAQTKEWRAAFLAHNGGTVDLVGWSRDTGDAPESLSFWIATGPNGHKACTYSTQRPAGLLDELTAILGAPDSLDRNDELPRVSAVWVRASRLYTFSRLGSVALVTIGPDR
jgi:hypothetical protein